ncbi:hypothetical protein CLU97_0390 [Chryseobacterium sp. 7]|nr:hypothetical protein CLU97_0390 [Chryseobacterium sp. 7]
MVFYLIILMLIFSKLELEKHLNHTLFNAGKVLTYFVL